MAYIPQLMITLIIFLTDTYAIEPQLQLLYIHIASESQKWQTNFFDSAKMPRFEPGSSKYEADDPTNETIIVKGQTI